MIWLHITIYKLIYFEKTLILRFNNKISIYIARKKYYIFFFLTLCFCYWPPRIMSIADSIGHPEHQWQSE